MARRSSVMASSATPTFASARRRTRCWRHISPRRQRSRPFRGIRDIGACDPDPAKLPAQSLREPFIDSEAASARASRGWRRSVSRSTRGCSTPRSRRLTALARVFPRDADRPQPFGARRPRPFRRHRDARFPLWVAGIRDLASCPNVMVKIGGLAMPSAPAFRPPPRAARRHLRAIRRDCRPTFDTCIDAFGSRARMFESNFPVDKPATPTRSLERLQAPRAGRKRHRAPGRPLPAHRRPLLPPARVRAAMRRNAARSARDAPRGGKDAVRLSRRRGRALAALHALSRGRGAERPRLPTQARRSVARPPPLRAAAPPPPPRAGGPARRPARPAPSPRPGRPRPACGRHRPPSPPPRAHPP